MKAVQNTLGGYSKHAVRTSKDVRRSSMLYMPGGFRHRRGLQTPLFQETIGILITILKHDMGSYYRFPSYPPQ
jgi:hypothetical protein